MSTSRNSAIYIDHQLQWLLWQIVKAHNSKLAEMKTPLTVDGLAGDVLMQWIKETKPELIRLYLRRKSIDDEAVQLLSKP